MNILIVACDKKSGEILREEIVEIQNEANIVSFDNSFAALLYARRNQVDIAFLDTKIPEMNGFILGSYLRELNSYINLIYITDDKSDAFEAMAVRASGCILNPVKLADVKTELSLLRNAAKDKHKRRVFAQTFGNFEIFVDGEPLIFRYSKTKEIIALLINNRGAQTTNGEIIAALWEDDDSKTSYLSNLRQDLMNTLKTHGIADIIAKQRGSMGIVKNHIECDIYDWLDKKEKSIYNYLGEYMSQYSWAEVVHAEIDNIKLQMEAR